MPKTKDTIEKGPIYGVELIDTLPLGTGPMLQQMPCRDDLERVAERSQRTVAGYEVLLAHYKDAMARLNRLRELCDKEMCDETQGPSETCCKMWSHIEEIIPAQKPEV